MMSDAPLNTGIEHVQVAIPPGGEDRARAFYGATLGMPEVAKPESLAARGGCWFACGSQQIHCGVEPVVARSRRHPALRVHGIHQLRERLVSAGYATADDLPLPGYFRFYATDPFGNRIEFLEPETKPEAPHATR